MASPWGWTEQEDVKYEFGEARYGDTHANKIPANQIGEGEGDSHSKFVDPEGEFGAAKTPADPKGFGGTSEYAPDGADPRSMGTLNLPFAHSVVEHGNVNFRDYYLVHATDTDKFYVIVPELKDGKQYKSVLKSDRVSALQDAYRVLSASLPDSALAQLRRKFPETPALS